MTKQAPPRRANGEIYRIRWSRPDEKRGTKYGFRHAGAIGRDNEIQTGPELEFRDRGSADDACARLNEHTTVYFYEVERK